MERDEPRESFMRALSDFLDACIVIANEAAHDGVQSVGTGRAYS
jgi:hypothetical protein